MNDGSAQSAGGTGEHIDLLSQKSSQIIRRLAVRYSRAFPVPSRFCTIIPFGADVKSSFDYFYARWTQPPWHLVIGFQLPTILT